MNKALKDYIKDTVWHLSKMHPEWNKDEIEEHVKIIVEERTQDPSIVTENNSNGTPKRKITLLSLCDWINDSNPIVAGNAVFYCQPEVIKSPTSAFLLQYKHDRSDIKKQLFLEEPGTDAYILLDLDSNNIKVIMNANYGASGNKAASWYNEYNPAAITLFAQSIITTAAAFFEGFIGDNQVFFHLNEFMDWSKRVLSKDHNIDKWIQIPTADEVSVRIISKFSTISPNECNFIRRYIKSLSKEERTLIYYANNLRGMIRNHSKIVELIRNILVSLPVLSPSIIPDKFKLDFLNEKDWNKYVAKAMFLDPYGVPSCIKSDLEKLHDIFIKYVFVEYLTPDSIVKLNNHERNTVLLVDTDSNGIYLGQIVDFINDEIFDNDYFGREKLYHDIIIVSIMTSLMSKCIAKILDFYGRCHNINAEGRKELSMKNEFLWTCFFVMMLKKHYGALVAMREGNIILPFKLDIKGMDFDKAAVSNEVSERFKGMLTDYILMPFEPDLRGLIREAKRFEKEIDNSILNGELTYFKTQVYKPFQAYNKKRNANGEEVSIAWTQQVFKGSEVWNIIEEEHKIVALDRVYIIKTIIESLDDLKELELKNPELYRTIKLFVYGNENLPIAKSGMSIICIPQSLNKIPDWLIPYVNRELVVSDIMSTFNSIFETFNVKNVTFKVPNGNDAKRISGLISI